MRVPDARSPHMQVIREAVDHREFLKQFTLQQLRGRYRGSVLGYVWTLLMPLLTLGMFAFVFAVINRMDARTFAPQFFGGYIPWMFFSSAATAAAGSIAGSAYLITRVRTPKAVFPLSAVLLSGVELLAFLPAAFVLMAVLGSPFSPAMLFLPVSVLMLALFAMGVAFLFATIQVFLRDFVFLWTTASFLWFFCTPIVYPLSSLAPAHQRYFELNPLLPFIRLFQDPIARGVLPAPETVAAAAFLGVVTFAAGAAVFSRAQRSFYAYL